MSDDKPVKEGNVRIKFKIPKIRFKINGRILQPFRYPELGGNSPIFLFIPIVVALLIGVTIFSSLTDVLYDSLVEKNVTSSAIEEFESNSNKSFIIIAILPIVLFVVLFMIFGMLRA